MAYQVVYLSISVMLWLILPFSFNTISGYVGFTSFVGILVFGAMVAQSVARRYESAARERNESRGYDW